MNWFKITVLQGERTYSYVGSSVHTLDELIDQATLGKFVRLDNLIYKAKEKTRQLLSSSEKWVVKEWSEWDSSVIPAVVINPKMILTIMQFKGDPRTLEK